MEGLNVLPYFSAISQKLRILFAGSISLRLPMSGNGVGPGMVAIVKIGMFFGH